MDMTKAAAIAKAYGLRDDIASRWLELPARAKEPKSNRFDVEGPIVDSSGMMFSDAGYTTPKMLREFLSSREGQAIEININSPGGSVFDANAMVSDLTRHGGPIKVVVSGACFSAATDLLCIPGSDRVAMPGSMFMIHNAWTIAVGDSRELQAVVDRLEKMNESCADRMAGAFGMDKDELKSMMDAETWFTEKEALASGLVDSIHEAAAETDAETEKKSAAAIARGQSAADSRLIAIL